MTLLWPIPEPRTPRADSGHRAALAASVLLLLAGLTACQMSDQLPVMQGPVLPPTATISFCNDGTSNCDPAASFSLAGLRDLVITVEFQNVQPGNHVQRLEILLPGGAPYRVTQGGLLISTDAPGSYSFTRSLPVVGTPIGLRHITGQWSVRASLDGQVLATEPVDLNP